MVVGFIDIQMVKINRWASTLYLAVFFTFCVISTYYLYNQENTKDLKE